MKALSALLTSFLVLFVVGCASISDTPVSGSLSAKAGDTIYVCTCPTCDCHVVALKPGKCGCGHDLAKVTVTGVQDQVATFEIDGKTLTAKLTGKYACACGSSCCQMISDKPGKCGCGMKLVKASK